VEPARLLAERFEIERLAGAGGMGRVYRAHDWRTEQPVAVKVLSAQGALEAERFAREATVLAGLSHPAIVRFVAHGHTDDGEPFLVTEWLEGEDLGARLRRAGLTIAEGLALGARVGAGLGEAHRHGIVHRDIKPGNLWLVDGRPEEVKILDFGIARSKSQDQTLTQAGAMIGTPGYMAPEQARGERQIDARADVFSLGCVIFKCLTGRLPFDGDDVMAVLLKLVLEDAPRLRSLCPEAPAALDELIGRMLSKTPAERPADGAAVAAEIALIEHHGGGPAAPPSASALALTTSERPVMCVVLARIALTLAESAAPSEATVAMPDARRRELVAALEAHAGELAVLADGSLVVTVPSAGAFTDQAARAARSALAVRAGYPEAAIAVVAGRGERAARLPMGEVIDRGVELLRATAPGAIRVDEGIAGLVAATFELRGDDAGLLLFGERAAEGKRTLLGRPTPFVGRDRELVTLEAIFDEVALDEVARAVLIIAAPGLGKSRLRLELIRKLRQRTEGPIEAFVPGASEAPRGREAGFELWLGRGDPMRAGSPFGLLAPMIRRLSGVLDGEPIEARRRKLSARVGRNLGGADRARVIAFLGELAGVPFPEEESVELAAARRDALLMGDQLRRAFEDFVAAELGTGPVLLVLDDLQWGDRPSLQLVDLALRNLHDRPLMVMALARPEIADLFPGLWAGRPVTQLKLGALTRKASERLVQQVLGPGAEPEVVARIVELASGDAFYLEELIRAVAERSSDRLPETVLAMVQQRLDGLDVHKRRVLRAASVFGGVFWMGGVHALLGGDERTPAVAQALADLAERELVHRRPLAKFPGEEEYVFRQTLVREAAYAMLTEPDRRLGHRLAAEWLERAGESDPVAVAEHFDRAGEPERALGAYHRAAAQALESNDFDQVLAWADRAIRSVPDAEASAARAEIGAVHLLRSEALRWRDELALAAPGAALAMALLPRGSAPWFVAAGEVAILSGRLGRDAQLAALADELDAMWTPEPETAHVVAAARAAAFLILRGDYPRADVLLARVAAVEPRVLEPAARARIDQAMSARAQVRGDLGVHLARTGAALAHFVEAGDQRNATLSRITLGFAHTTVARYEDAARELRAALATAERMALPALAAYAKHTLGYVVAQLGAFDEAVALETEAVESFTAHGDARLSGGSRVYLGMIRAQRGELAAAEDELDRAVAELATVPPVRAVALAARARVRLTRVRSAEALADAEAASALLRDLGGIEEGEALVRLAHVEALLAAGRRDEAREASAEARRRLFEQAGKISDDAMRDRFLHVVADNARTLALAEELGAEG
jgi:tetratricopeptide (TPR) repeat protein